MCRRQSGNDVHRRGLKLATVGLDLRSDPLLLALPYSPVFTKGLKAPAPINRQLTTDLSVILQIITMQLVLKKIWLFTILNVNVGKSWQWGLKNRQSNTLQMYY